MGKIYAIVRMAVEPGQEAAFRAQAAVCLEAACEDLNGTQAYEWFISADGRSCTVIEVYDGAEGMARHGKAAGRAVGPLRQLATFDMTLAGDLPAELLEAYRKRMGAVAFAGKRILGRLDEPAPGAAAAAVSPAIFALADFAIKPGKLAEFRALAEECFALVESNEPGTFGYEWFLDLEREHCLTLDIYRDAAALGAHMANAGPTMAKILAIVESDVRLFGAVPAPVLARFKPGLGVTYMAPRFQGLL